MGMSLEQMWLAKNLISLRKLSGEEATQLIEHTYRTLREAEAKMFAEAGAGATKA